MKINLFLLNSHAAFSSAGKAFMVMSCLAFIGLAYLVYHFVKIKITSNSKNFAQNTVSIEISSSENFKTVDSVSANCHEASGLNNTQQKPAQLLSAKSVSFKYIALLLFSIGILTRLVLAALYDGHQDVSYFRYFTDVLVRGGLGKFYDTLFYQNDMGYNNYLPGYLFILYGLGMLSKLLSIPLTSSLFTFLLKTPAIASDILSAYIIYTVSKKLVKKEVSLAFSLLYLLNPAVIMNSAVWGQMDSFIAMFTLLSINALMEKKYFAMTIFVALGIIFKLQFAFAVPVIGIVVLLDIIDAFKNKNYYLIKKIALCIPFFISIFFLLSLPFTFNYLTEQPFFILKAYSGQVGYYEYFSLNAFNFYSFIGLNCVRLPPNEILGFISYDALNLLIVTFLSLFTIILYAINPKRKYMALLAAYLIIGIFTFALKMHERYVFAALLPMLYAVIRFNKDKRLFLLFVVFSVLQCLNLGILLTYPPGTRFFDPSNTLLIIFSFIWTVCFIYFTYVVVDIIIITPREVNKKSQKALQANVLSEHTNFDNNYPNGDIKNIQDLGHDFSIGHLKNINDDSDEKKTKPKPDKKSVQFFDVRYKAIVENREKSKLKKIDYILISAITLLYFLINLINLGGTNVPQTFWEVTAEGSAEYIVLEIADDMVVGEIWGYKGIDVYENAEKNGIKVYASNSVAEGDFSDLVTQANYKTKKFVSNNGGKNSAQMYKWFKVTEFTERYKYIAFSCENKGVRINEIVLLEKDTRNIIDYKIAYSSKLGEGSAINAYDERATFPGYNSLMTDMYFDEIYHARTAYEHIQGWTPYEVTHPPLGKIIIGIGIRAFGMNPFGWRIMGVIFSAMLMPVLYLIGKELFKSTKWTVFFTLLMFFEGLHFVQGRIATIDTYIVFFSSVAMLYMIKFFKTNILREKIVKCLIPLAVAGIFFGLAAATKWTGIYTGAGMFIILLIYIYRMLDEYRYNAAVVASIENNDEILKKFSKAFDLKLIYIILTCILFFIIIPFAIYLLSYLPYLVPANAALGVAGETRSLFKIMFDNQSNMLYYHGKWVVDKVHPCQSQWWTWPLNLKSVYFYNAGASFGNDVYARIHTLGNPVISWTGIFAIACFVFVFIKPHIKRLNEKANADLPLNANTGLKDSLLLCFIGLLAAYLPWVFVARSTYIYHFYPSMPYYCAIITMFFIMLCKKKTKVVYTLKLPFVAEITENEKQESKFKLFGLINISKNYLNVTLGGLLSVIFIALVIIVFAMLFPLYTGIPVSNTAANILFRWLNAFKTHYGL